jgi:hypothetical protein
MACNPFINKYRDITGTTTDWTDKTITAAVAREGTQCKYVNRDQCKDVCENDQPSSTPTNCDRCLSNSLTCTKTDPAANALVATSKPADNVPKAACCPFVFEALECSRCLDKETATLTSCQQESSDVWLIVGLSVGGFIVLLILVYVFVRFRRSRKRSLANSVKNRPNGANQLQQRALASLG